jgi:hypothetical protein
MPSSSIRIALSILATCVVAPAVETENLDIRVLPSPGAVVVDGDWKDWDLSGGILACGDAKTQRDRFSVWVHLMYDADNLHILARWRDETPMNNPGSTKGDMGFLGDSLQFRTIWAYDKDAEVVAHWTAWRDRDGLDLIDVAYGRTFKDGKVRDAQDQGAQQAFAVSPDGKGYVQEMSIPWTLVNRGRPAPKPGESFRFTVEPNFLVGGGARLTIKDVFRAGVPVDRIFTFRGYDFWGAARLESTGKVEPQKVRLSDGREFAVTMRDGLPVVDWTGLIERRDLTGFEDLAFDVPADGYVTVVVRDAAGQVVRHLLNGAFFTKGKQTVKWDGLSTPWLRNPGKPVEAGNYTWEGIWNPGLNLRFRGWACNDGKAPWDADATANWGGDHGPPTECHFDGKRMYLGWQAAEAGKSLLCVDLDAKVQWRHVRGGIGGAQLIAVAGGHVFYRDDRVLVKLDAKNGGYVAWEGRADATLDAASILPQGADGIAGLAAVGTKLYVSANKLDAICELEASSGALVRTFTVPKPGRLAIDDGRLLVVSGGERLLAVALADGAVTTLASGFAQAQAVAVDAAGGRLLVSTRDPDHQIVVLDRAGKEVSRLGAKGGRPERGPWQPERLRNPEGMAVDAKGRLWVAEATETPRRFSIWNLADGSFVRDLLGPTHYGASGSTTWSKDPNVLIGEGCEWRLDPQTGHSTITGTFDDAMSGFSRMQDPGNGRTYLTTSHARGALLKIFERVAPGDWKLRATISNDAVDQRTREEDRKTLLWSDVNGDEVQQPEEVAVLPYPVRLAGYTNWSHFTAPDLSLNVTASRFISGDPAKPKARKAKETFVLHIPRAGFTACGAPLWNIAGAIARPIPNAAGLDSLDGKTMCRWLENAVECFTVDGNRLWSYPNTFSGVHGSHRATAPEPGMLRGAFGIIGTARLPTLGNIWALNGNCGEWYLMSERYGFVSQLFQGDPMRFAWPDKAVPGVLMDSVPSGAGAEDFGGTLVQGADGKVYLTAGKTGIWSLEVTGFDGIRPISGGALTIEPAELPLAQAEYERQRQAAATGKRLMIKRLAAAPTFTGDPKDLKELGATPAEYSKQESASVKTALAYDDTKLYLHFEVRDDSPWVNGADAAPYLYARGDTVDVQIGTDPGLNPKRSEAGRGDLRLSIGSFKGKPTAVLYRRIADQAKPMTFSSGVVKAYEMQSVTVLDDAEIVVKPNPTQRRYVVQAAIPLATLGLAPKAGLVLRGDVGVTHGDLTGNDTALRTYWSNQMTGLVSDEVFELEMKPENWSDLAFE